MSENRPTLRRGLPLVGVGLGLCLAGSCLGAALLALPVAPAPSSNLTVTLRWSPLTNMLWLLENGTTNASYATNASLVTERIAITNRYVQFKPLTNYTVKLGTNRLVTTNGTAARVSVPRGTAPTFNLFANLTDGQSLLYGWLAFPTNVQQAALLTFIAERADTLATGFQPFATNGVLVEGLTNLAGYYQARLVLTPLGSNVAGLVFNRNTVLITNTP